MSSGSSYIPGASTPTLAYRWINEVWAKTLDRQAYEKDTIWKKFKQFDYLGNKFHIPKHDNLTPASVADTTDLYEPTFSSNNEGETTITPGAIRLNVAIDDRTLARMAFDPTDTVKESIIMAMNQKVDQDAAANFNSLTTNSVGAVGADLTFADVLAARSAVKAGAKEYADVGDYIFVYHVLQDDNIMGISQFTQFIVRGKTDSAANTGYVGSGYGIQFVPSSNVYNTGAGFANAMFVSRAFGQGWSIKPKVEVQRHGPANWLIGLADYGSAIIRDAYACKMLSKNT